MMSLKYDNFRFYWAVVTEKISVYAKVLYLSAGILSDKSDFTPVIDFFKGIRLVKFCCFHS